MDATGDSEPHIVDTLGGRPILGLLSTADRVMRGMRDILLQPFAISTTEYAVLARLRDAGSRTTAELAREVYLTPQGTGQTLARLEGQGYVAKDSDPTDARRIPVRMTEKGHDLLHRARAALIPVEQVMLDGMTDREVLVFGMFLEVVLHNLEEAHWDRRFTPRPAAD